MCVTLSLVAKNVSNAHMSPCSMMGHDGRVVKAGDLRSPGVDAPRGFEPRSCQQRFFLFVLVFQK